MSESKTNMASTIADMISRIGAIQDYNNNVGDQVIELDGESLASGPQAMVDLIDGAQVAQKELLDSLIAIVRLL